MVGLSGVLGQTGHPIGVMRDALARSGREHVFDFERPDLAVSSGHHPIVAEEQPIATTDGNTLVWTWGNLFGYEDAGGYHPLPDGVETPASACARLVERFGLSAVKRLNGTFACLVYDEPDGVAHLCTDRFGTRPLHHSRHPDGAVVFSNDIQSLARHPGVDTSFDVAHLCEYFTTARVSGCCTPLTGIQNVPPGTILSVDLDTGRIHRRQYWQPRYRPLDRPFSYFVEQFTECFQRVIDERLEDHRTYGVLLSGGSDSRLVLAAAGADVVAYHLSDWMSDEARLAERSAHTNGSRFRWLQRDTEYDRRVLDEAPEVMNFYGRFDQAHTDGFQPQIREEVDVLISGLYSDTLFRGLPLPRPELSLGRLGTLTLPTERPVSSVDDFVSQKTKPLPAYLDAPTSLEEVLRENINRKNGAIDHHGVEYPSVRELVSLCEVYPLSNDPDLFYYSLTMAIPHWTPFLDNRLVDLALRLPLKYQLRKNIVNAAISRISPDLAAIPHCATGVPLDSSFPAQYFGRYLTSMKRKRISDASPPIPHYSHDAWTDKIELLKTSSVMKDTLYGKRDLIDRLPFLSWEGVRECYRDHRNGGRNQDELLTLLGFLEMPVVEYLAVAEPLESDEMEIPGGYR